MSVRFLQNCTHVLYCSRFLPTFCMEEPIRDSQFLYSGQKASRSMKKLFFLVFVILLLGFIGFSSFQFVSGQLSIPAPSSTPTPVEDIFPTNTGVPTNAPTPTTTPSQKQGPIDKATGLDRSVLQIAVQNGSGQKGVANQAAETLRQLGYTVSSIGNADTFEYIDVTILTKPSVTAKHAQLLRRDLSETYQIASISATLSASSAANVVVIIGK